MAIDWQVVTSSKGVVLGVLGGAPRHWVNASLEDSPDVPPELRMAAQVLLRELHGSTMPLSETTLTLPEIGGTVQLIALQAVPIRRQPTDVRALLDSMMNAMRHQAQAIDVTLKVRVAEDVPTSVRIDTDKVAWAVSALVGNALRYVRAGSRVMPGGMIEVNVSYTSVAGAMTIIVQDDGRGIPEDKRQGLLQPGTQASPGAGLGLLIVRDVVVAHGGSMDVESSAEPFASGTTVRLTLPV